MNPLGRAPLLGALLLLGCGAGAPAAPPPREPAPEAPLHEGPLTDYVPAAGLRWLCVARLEQLAQTPSVAQALGPLFPAQRLDAFASMTSVDLRKTPVALAAGFDFATLYVAEVGALGPAIETLFEERLVAGRQHRQLHPRVQRWTGLVGKTPQTLVSVRGRLAAVAVGDPTPARVVAGYALGRLRSKPALEGAALSTLPPRLGEAPLVFLAPGPFSDEWLDGAQGLLASALALGVSATPDADGGLAVELILAGDYAAASRAEARLGATWASLAASPLGGLLGLDRPRRAATIERVDEGLRMTLTLDLQALGAGLHHAVGAEVRELMASAARRGHD